jgi:hypothetical protein
VAKDHLAYMGIPRGRSNEEGAAGEGCPTAWAGLEVDSVSKMYLEDLEQIDKSPSKCRQTRDPHLRGQSPKRLGLPSSSNKPIRCGRLIGAYTHSSPPPLLPSSARTSPGVPAEVIAWCLVLWGGTSRRTE